ncbi:hypothetical protein E2P71_03535 [Candidatus Bathyarchaeota archaeon]|nr:hypothetical protein E2P71_03535 [Candidatus Bathyarchaeota archaeon]
MKNNEVVEDVLWYAARDVGRTVLAGIRDEINTSVLSKEVGAYLSGNTELSEHPNLKTVFNYMRGLQPWSKPVLVNDLETLVRDHPEAVDPEVYADYIKGAVAFIAHTLLAENQIDEATITGRTYLPSRMS